MANLLYIDIAKQLEKQILTGILKEDDKLPSERIMAENYGVSRNVVREALRVLNEKGLIAVKTGKGGYVTAPQNDTIINKLEVAIYNSKSSILEVVDVREILELAIAKKVITAATDENIEKLKNIYNDMENSIGHSEQFAENDANFHIELANCTRNSMLAILTSTFYKITDEKMFLMSQLYPNRVTQAQREHKSMIDAIEARDINALTKSVKSHIHCLRSQLTEIDAKLKNNELL